MSDKNIELIVAEAASPADVGRARSQLGEPLDDESLADVLGKLPSPPQAQTSEFVLRSTTQPPPRTGEDVRATIGAVSEERAAPPTAVDGATVTRVIPTGEVDVAAKLTVTFDRPVAPVGWEGTPPFELEPPLPGAWRALGTHTLVLEPEDRLPGSTTCTITVPAGSQMPSGVHVAQRFESELVTAAVKLIRSYPTGQLCGRESAVVVLQFDQRVKPEAMLEHLVADGGLTLVAHDLETLYAIDPEAAEFAKSARPGTWLALRTAPLRAGEEFSIAVPAGAPSLEGPLRTSEPQHAEFEVAGPFVVTGVQDYNPSPAHPWVLSTSTMIDLSTLEPDDFEIEPEPPGPLHIHGYHQRLSLTFATAGSTKYLLRVPNTLRDVHGQRLGGNREFLITTTEATPALYGGRSLATVLVDAPRRLHAHVTNLTRLDVSVYEVEPEDWFAFNRWVRNADDARPPGTLLGKRAIDLTGTARDATEQISIDVGWALPQGDLGHRIVVARPTPSHSQWPIPPIRTWLQSTRLGVTVWEVDQPATVWVTDLATGEPRAGCVVTTTDGPQTVRSEPTGSDGSVGLAMLQAFNTALVAAEGDDTCIVPVHGAGRSPHRPTILAHVFDDRGIYRPGEEVTISGWARAPHWSRRELEIVRGPARLTVKDQTQNEVASEAVTIDDQGRFDVSFWLADNVALGDASVEISVPRLGTFHHKFDVQEFRRPEYEVNASLADAGPHIVGDHMMFTARASYYTGEPLRDAATHWDVSAKTTTYSPPGWLGFVFGRQSWPWFSWFLQPDTTTAQTIEGRTDASGRHHIEASIPHVDPPEPVLVTARPRVTDVNRQAWSATVSSVVHPSSLCVGARAARTFVSEGEVLHVDVIATDLDGTPVVGRQLVVALEHGVRRQVRGEWDTEWKEVHRETMTSDNAPTTVELATVSAGSHRVVLTSADGADRIARSELDVWVSGARRNTIDEDDLTLVPNTPIIEAPVDAEFAIAAPFSSGFGRWFLIHNEVVASGEFEFESGCATITVPIGDDLLPRITLAVGVVGVDADGVPATATGTLDVPVWDRNRRLDVVVRATSAAVEPGSRAEVDVAVRRPDGTAAAGGFATVWAVDEAVLSLTAYETPDPLASLYPPPRRNFLVHSSRTSILRPTGSGADAAPEGAVNAVMGGVPGAMAPQPAARAVGYGGGAAAEPQPVAVRTNFSPLATFQAGVALDADGCARVSFDLPDSLTRYRIIANAQLGAGFFGCGDCSLTARLPLMVRPSPPRFANFGDRFELGVVVQNASSARCDVDVALRADNLQLARGDHDGRRITLAAGERAEVRFPVSTESPGEATFDVIADTVSSVDAASGKLRVYSPATTEAAATYGTLDEGLSEHIVVPPEDAVTKFGGLEVTTSSTALQALTDAVLYLARYPYDCAEQRASRLLSLTALRDALSAFEAEELPAVDELEGSVRVDIDSLARMQNGDGGWGFWRGESWPIVSIHAVHALVQARKSGADVRPDVLARGLAYLDQIEQHIDGDGYPQHVRLNMRAYTAFVRTRAGVSDVARARAVVKDSDDVDNPPLAAAAWCLAVLHDEPVSEVLTRFALNRVSETESTAVFAADLDRSGQHLMLGSERRTDAVMLWALMDAQPDSHLIPKIVYGLLAHRKRGRWGSTQENSHVLLALKRYFDKYETVTPDFVARAWLGDRYAGEHHFNGRTTERHHVHVPMATLAEQSQAPLLLQKDGAGRMYYRVGIRYARTGSEIAPLDRGFVVDRRYEALDAEGDVGQRDDGTWVVRAGARVRVVVTMVVPVRRHHVALIDPMPAGFEALNPALAVTEKLPHAPTQTGISFGYGSGPIGGFLWWARWQRTWYEHQNLRDERAEAFSSLVWEGTHDYVYHARAATVGEFVVPPPKAEEMYSPEVFGRGSSARVVVVDA